MAKAKVQVEVAVTPKEEIASPVVAAKPNQWSKRVKATPQEVLNYQSAGKLVGYEEENGIGYALIR